METSEVASRALRTVRVWDLPLRLFHWLLVAAIVVAFLSSEKDSALNDWHVLAGWVAGILIVFRIFWGFVGGAWRRSAHERAWRHLQVGAVLAKTGRKASRSDQSSAILGCERPVKIARSAAPTGQ